MRRKTKYTSDPVELAKRRFRAAVQRTRYWGSPAGLSKSCSPRSEKDPAIEYEMAMDDQESIADEIHQLTGRRPKIRDFKAEDALVFDALNQALHAS